MCDPVAKIRAGLGEEKSGGNEAPDGVFQFDSTIVGAAYEILSVLAKGETYRCFATLTSSPRLESQVCSVLTPP
jgi:hypothetical protein